VLYWFTGVRHAGHTNNCEPGTFVPRDHLQPGDLVFFYSPVHHVAIYMGNGKIIHTYGKPGVTITDLNSGWWSSHYNTARRVLPNGQAAPTTVSSPVAATPTPAVQPVKGSPIDRPSSPAAAVKHSKALTAAHHAETPSRHHMHHHVHHHQHDDEHDQD
jgi:hypothetical protein